MLQIGKPGKEKYIICYFLLRNLSFDFTIIIFARHDVNNLDHYQSKVKEPIANERKRRTSQPSNLVKSISSNNSNIHPAKKPKPSPKKNVRFQVFFYEYILNKLYVLYYRYTKIEFSGTRKIG